jgi:hypothetical protein
MDCSTNLTKNLTEKKDFLLSSSLSVKCGLVWFSNLSYDFKVIKDSS